MPGIALAGNLPADGSAHGFDKHPDALDISHVNVKKYLEAADHILNYAIATRPRPPTIQRRRISLVNRGGFVAHVVMNGDGVLLKNGQPDPDFPPAAEQNHLDQGAHERWGSFRNGATVGALRLTASQQCGAKQRSIVNVVGVWYRGGSSWARPCFLP